MATDLAEFLGAAIGFDLLIGTSLLVSCVLTAIASFAILELQSYGFRPFEALIASLVGVIGVCYLVEIFYSHPDLGRSDEHAVIPSSTATESRAARGRDPRRDGDAARDLPPLGADAGPDRRRVGRGRPDADALHAHRRARRDVARRR